MEEGEDRARTPALRHWNRHRSARLPPSSRCPGGGILDKSDAKRDSKPACSGVLRKVEIPAKVVILGVLRAREQESQESGLLPPESSTSVIIGGVTRLPPYLSPFLFFARA